MNDQKGFIAAIIIIVALVVGIYHTEDTIDVTARWWQRTVDIKYDVTTMRPVRDTREICTGFGADRQCRTVTTITMKSETTTHIRCMAQGTGAELPTIMPVPACRKHLGDYVGDNTYYYATYIIVGKDKTVTTRITVKMWQVMEPGSRRFVKRNFFRTVIGIAEE